MKIGVFSILPNREADPAIVARKAEELGFSSYWVPDHTVLPVQFSDAYPGVRPGEPKGVVATLRCPGAAS